MSPKKHQPPQFSLFDLMEDHGMKAENNGQPASPVANMVAAAVKPSPAPAPSAVPTKASVPVKATPAKKSAFIKSHVRTGSLEVTYNALVRGLREFFDKTQFRRAVLGVSGGVDSALTLKIAVDALGAENVTGLIMPELGLTKQENIDHAKILCQFLGVKYHAQPINNFLMDFVALGWRPSSRAQMNTKARVRAVLLYSFANTENALVLGTSNKSEILLGYGTKYGDLAADVEVIGELLKTDAVKLADYVDLPPEIVNKKPSAELSPGQTDEEELGATYEDLDKVLSKLDMGKTACLEHGLPAPLVNLVFRRAQDNKHKSEMPYIIRL